ncbi:YkgJ family cysteine cluster protein [Halalkalirubrum salinum]|uniref:YkgJ family cysteine cluster protein n=1 Tax=Halalkalirubrum salinum TaxID=2563889 RepID=UPI0010FAD87D|nr:YkgJ family cysteine cluster protein [Halalkalirubrum salinum]
MDVNCEGCAGCCIDWRPIADVPPSAEHGSDRPPIDDTYNLAPLRSGEARSLVDAGYGDAMTPRLFEAGPDDDSVRVDGVALAAIGNRPVFYLGLRKPTKAVAPFDGERRWLPACCFLDPETLQCRIHDSELYPNTCRVYPGYNLQLERETECERVETSIGGPKRLLDSTPPADADPTFSAAIGTTVFAYPDPDELSGIVSRLAAAELTDDDRTRFVGVACGSSPGTIEINEAAADRYRELAAAADSWVGRSIQTWDDRADTSGSAATIEEPGAIETADGAPETPGWDAVRAPDDGSGSP